MKFPILHPDTWDSVAVFFDVSADREMYNAVPISMDTFRFELEGDFELWEEGVDGGN